MLKAQFSLSISSSSGVMVGFLAYRGEGSLDLADDTLGEEIYFGWYKLSFSIFLIF